MKIFIWFLVFFSLLVGVIVTLLLGHDSFAVALLIMVFLAADSLSSKS